MSLLDRSLLLRICRNSNNGQTKIASTKGRVVDHVAFSVDDVNATVSRLRSEGVKILEPLKTTSGGRFKHAFIEGPDYIRIELVEGAVENALHQSQFLIVGPGFAAGCEAGLRPAGRFLVRLGYALGMGYAQILWAKGRSRARPKLLV